MTGVPGRTLRLGSRKSPMAITQSRQVADMITERTGRRVEIVGVTTLGDVSRAQLTQIGGTGVFVSALREALLGGEVDLAVHSLKDLPAGPAAGIVLAAVPPRDDPRDALVARDGAKLADLPPGPGSGPARRGGPRSCSRCALTCAACRSAGTPAPGWRKVTDGELDGVVLACAGLARIGSRGAVTQVFEPDEMLPAPGQGALAVECRDGEPELAELLAAVNDAAEHGRRRRRAQPARGARGRLQRAGRRVRGGDRGQLLMRAVVLSTDGTRALRAHGSRPRAPTPPARPRPRGGAAAPRGRRSRQQSASTDEQRE